MTDLPRLSRVVEATRRRAPSDFWSAKRGFLARQRRDIEASLAERPDIPVYGFNTLLGPLDNSSARVEDQLSLLDAHLVGARRLLSPFDFCLISSVKLEQLSHGGSGISPYAYDVILHSGYVDRAQLGSWASSYGAGDVVPGAWWVNSVFDDGLRKDLRAGDLIALINGNFVSTGTAISCLDRLVDAYVLLLTRIVPRCAKLPVASCDPSSEAIIDLLAGGRWSDRAVQAPVSIRDPRSYVEPVVRELRRLSSAIEMRLSKPSVNPLFVLGEGGYSAVSQNSFLDVGLTLAVDSARASLVFLTSGLHRVADQISRETQNDMPNAVEAAYAVQPPKLIRTLLVSMDKASKSSVPSSINESGGVEDLADGSLLACQELGRSIRLVRESVDLFDVLAKNDMAEDWQSLVRTELWGACGVTM